MRQLLTLAAAAFLAVGCAGNNEDETGAAPDQGDATVTATDTSTSIPTDSTMGQRPAATDTSLVQQDTTMADPGMSADTTMAEPGMGADSSQTLPGAESDSVGAEGQVQTDTTGMEMPA
ncbi:MAG: hypothetical protein H0T58_00885, partial [Gemmatimonadales bacterium]|nr:hypothetical protein [Gemmatimonadales bacterium]